MKIKKWNGSAWVQDYAEVNIASIVATGTPSGTTFLRGDGTWAVPNGVDNYVNTTGDTMSGQLTSTVATGTAPFVIASTTRVSNLNVATAGTADTLTTGRTINVSTGATGTATSFNGSANISIPITGVSEAYLTWGGKSLSDQVTPIGMALSNEHSANRLAFINGDSLYFEYSSDGGSTWTDYGYSASIKSQVCTTSTGILIGRTSGEYTTSSRTRITLTAQNGTTGYVYTNPKKMLINISSSGGMNVLVEYRSGTNYQSSGAWTTFGTYSLIGWSGWNDIPLILGTLGGGTTQTGNNWQLRLTFIMTSKDVNYPTTAQLNAIRIFGENAWQVPSTLAGTNNLYSYDMSQNATFPGNLLGATVRTTQDGSAGAPGIGFSQDTNTGLFRPAEDTLAFAEGGVEAMRITSTGTLGIGVTTTNAQLDVKDTIHITNSQNTQHGLMLENRGTYFDNTGKPGIWSSSGIVSGSFSGEGGHLIIEGRKNSARNIYVKVGDTTTPTHIFKADGNVGIGTTSPSVKLHVMGGLRIESAYPEIYLTDSNSDSDYRIINNNGDFGIYDDTNASFRMMVKADGKVGIGTTAPNDNLHIGIIGATLRVGPHYPTIDSTSDRDFITLTAGSTDSVITTINETFTIQNSQSAGIVRFNTEGTERVRITSSGSLSIGEATLGEIVAKLHINGNVNINSGYLRWANGNAQIDGQDTNLKFLTWTGSALTEKMRITGAGNVGIGTTSPAHPLTVSGTLTGSTSQIGIRNSEGGMAIIRAGIAGINNSGFSFITANEDNTNQNLRMVINASGNVGIGTSSPVTTLSLVTPTNADGIQIRRNSNTINDYATLGFRVRTTDGANYAEIRAVRTDRAISTDTDLRFYTLSNTSNVEVMRMRDDGLVGINETSPTAQLVVKSGATTRVPLIIDTLASQTANLQEWKVNGSQVFAFNSNGVARIGFIANASSSNNANIEFTNNGAVIRRNIADTNPALIVNLENSSATGNIQVWQKAGTAKAWITNAGGAYFDSYIFTSTGISNNADTNNALINTPSTGAIITRNINDANSALKVNLAHASSTGRILDLQFNGVTKAYVDKDGGINAVNLTLSGDLTVNGTTTNINTTNLVVEDKNIILGDVTTPSDTTADGGGITLKGATDKTITWVDSTDRWTSNQVFSAPNYVSTVATGTEPYATTSTTVNTNLNADLLDGNHASAFALASHTHTVSDISATGTPSATTVLAGNGNWLESNAHSHGNINLNGQITSLTITPADQDRILIADASNNGKIERGIIIGTSTSTFLREDGTWSSVTASNVGLGNVTNESKATMFTSPTFTGVVNLPNSNTVAINTGTTSGSITFNTAQTYTGPYLRGQVQDLYRGYYTATYKIWDEGNDGSGSGLDADTLDGNQATAFATASHTHAATDITSGTIATARLGSGTANTTTYLRGDNTWSTAGIATYSTATLYVKRIYSRSAVSGSTWTERYDAGTGAGTTVSTTATWTAIALGYTPSTTTDDDQFLIEFSNNTSSDLEKGICMVGYGTFSSTAGMSVISYDAYETIDGTQLKIAKYYAQWRLNGSDIEFRYGSKMTW